MIYLPSQKCYCWAKSGFACILATALEVNKDFKYFTAIVSPCQCYQTTTQ